MKFTENEEKDWICSHFDKMIQTHTTEEWNQYIFSHPLLLSLNALPIISEKRGENSKANTAIKYLDSIRKKYWDQPESYPFGLGPIEKIIESLKNGSINQEEANLRARDINCSGLLSPLYIRALMVRLLDELNIDINFTMKSVEVAIEAVIAMPLPTFSLHTMMQSTEGYIRLAHGSLIRRPDGQVYNKAISLGQWSVNVANASHNYPLGSDFLHIIGSLSLDAYAANFGPNEDYFNNINNWLKRAVNPMPEPSLGLENARIFISDSIEFRDIGSPRGKTIKALLETIVYENFYLGKKPDIHYLSQLAKEALDNLDPIRDSAHIQRVNEIMGIYA